jgi:predicted component of type VI protein secretion system
MTVKMVVVQGRPAGKTLVFPDGVYYIGRGAECHIRPNSEWVSRQHCVLRVSGPAVFIRDLGSRNGTLVNGVLLDGERRLDRGDQVQVGPLVFEVSLDEDTSVGRGPTREVQFDTGLSDAGPPPMNSTEDLPSWPFDENAVPSGPATGPLPPPNGTGGGRPRPGG